MAPRVGWVLTALLAAFCSTAVAAPIPAIPDQQLFMRPKVDLTGVVYGSNTINTGTSDLGLIRYGFANETAINYLWWFEPLYPGGVFCGPQGCGCGWGSANCPQGAKAPMPNVAGMYAFHPVKNPTGRTGLYCLDIYQAKGENGVPVIVYPCHYGPNQRFNVYGGCGERSHLLQLKAFNSGLCLRYDMTTQKVVQWTCDQSDDFQLFDFYGNTSITAGFRDCPSPPPAPAKPPGAICNACRSPSCTNLALKKLAYQSSDMYAPLGLASAAVDGSLVQSWSTSVTCTHTSSAATSWWFVDLNVTQAIGSVVIYNRADCCGERLAGAIIRAGNVNPSSNLTANPIFAVVGAAKSGDVLYYCANVKARYISVQVANTAVTLCEVLIYPPAECADGYQSGQETDVDCGGPTCNACANNYKCLKSSDCVSGFCNLVGICQTVQPPTPPSMPACNACPMCPDLALKKTAYQSSTLSDPTVGFGYANNAIDGNLVQTWTWTPNVQTCSHTSVAPNSWWFVDLQVSQAIGSIVIYNRADCCGDRLVGAVIRAGDVDPKAGGLTANPIYSTIGAAKSGDVLYYCANVKARYVSVQTAANVPLTLCEVLIYPPAGCADGVKNGNETDVDCGGSTCNVCANDEKCLKGSDCASGFCNMAGVCTAPLPPTPPSSMPVCNACPKCTNLALNMMAYQSSNMYAPLGYASAAINGDLTQRWSWSTATCSHTLVDSSAWWFVDLQSTKAIGSVVIYNRADCCGSRLNGAVIRAGNVDPRSGGLTQNPIFATVGTLTGGEVLSYCSNMKARYVSVQVTNQILTLCEVLIYPPAGCADGVKNGDETDVDCGGATCNACANNQKCAKGSDCASGFCGSSGTCQTPVPPTPPPAATCSDGIKNQGESDADCGGTNSCSRCPSGKKCTTGTDCASTRCLNGMCAALPSPPPPPPAASCSDGAKNGNETDVDCGSAKCPACANGKKCLVGADCASMLCINNVCSAPPPAAPCTYTVKTGDTCCTIAKAKGTCLDTLVKLNPWIETFTPSKCTNVQPGMSIIVPCVADSCTSGTPTTCATNCTYIAKWGDTCGCIAKTLGINTATLYGFNAWVDSDPLTKCSNMQVDSQIVYPCKPSSTQATGTDPDAKCPPPSPPEPPCYANQCPGPDTPCIPDNSTALTGNPTCAQLLSVYGLPGACYGIVTGKTGVPFQCPCMCAGICSDGYCGDGVCGPAAKCAKCTCPAKASPSPPPPSPPAPPPPRIVPNCSTGEMLKNVYFSSPSVTVRNGMCITVNSSKVLNLQSCSKRSNLTDTFTLSSGFPNSWFTITNVKTGLCVELTKTITHETITLSDGVTTIDTTITTTKVILNTCSATDGQQWKYSYYLGLLQVKTGFFLSPSADSMNAGTILVGYDIAAKRDIAYGNLTRSWIVWPTNGPPCGFTGAVVSLTSDNVDRSPLTVANITWPVPQGVSPVGATVAGVLPTNLKMCLDATTIQVFRGIVQGMVSFLPCVAGKASQYVQTVAYNKLDWAVSAIGDAAFSVANIPSGWPEGQFFVSFPKVKPNICFDIYMAQGRNVAIIHFACHPKTYPGNQLWSVDWTRGHVRSVIPSNVNITLGEQGKKGNPVCAHFEKFSMNVLTGNCSGDYPANKFLWWPMPHDLKGYQQNYESFMLLG